MMSACSPSAFSDLLTPEAHAKMKALFHEWPDSVYPLHLAHSREAVAWMCDEYGAKVDTPRARGFTALMDACAAGESDVARAPPRPRRRCQHALRRRRLCHALCGAPPRSHPARRMARPLVCRPLRLTARRASACWRSLAPHAPARYTRSEWCASRRL